MVFLSRDSKLDLYEDDVQCPYHFIFSNGQVDSLMVSASVSEQDCRFPCCDGKKSVRQRTNRR